MDTTSVLLSILLSIISVSLIGRLFKKKKGKTIPGPKELPWLGSVLTANISKLHLTCYSWAQEFGDIFQLTLFGQKLIVMNDADVIRTAYAGDTYGDCLSDRPRTFVGEHVLYKGSDIFFSTSYDKKTIAMRKMLHKCLRMYGDGHERFETIVQDEIARMLQDIQNTAGKDFRLKPVIRYSFGNWMSILLSGKQATVNDSKLIWQFNESITVLLETSLSILFTKFPFIRHAPFWPGNLYGQVMKSRDELIFKYVSEENRNADSDEGMVNVLVKYQREQNSKAGGELITDDNVKGIILDMIAAGMTTTVTLVYAGMLVLLNNPEYIKPIQEEIGHVIGQDRPPRIRDKKDMDYTSAVIYELLRYITHGVLGVPHIVTKDIEVMGYHFSKDSLMYTNNWFIHRNDKFWPDPWVFRPSRFLDDEGKLVEASHPHRQNLMSFSVGRRVCIGSELALNRAFIYITSILQKFDILPPSEGPLMDDDPRNFQPGIVLEPIDFSCRMTVRV